MSQRYQRSDGVVTTHFITDHCHTIISWWQTAKRFWQTWLRLLQLELSPYAAAALLSSCGPGRHSTAAGHRNPGQRDRPGPAASAGESGKGNRNDTQQQLKSNRQLIQRHAGRASRYPVKSLVLSRLVKRKTLGWKNLPFLKVQLDICQDWHPGDPGESKA